MNQLYYGNNLDILRLHIRDESVDLIYLDPPFKSNQDYNVLFEEQNGTRAAAQIKAFEDTWEWNPVSAKAYAEVIEAGGRVADVMRAFNIFLSGTDMMAYLAMMAPRLVELRRVLRPTGSIYLHCDPTASHYLKILLDAIFGPGNFRNEIIWSYQRYTAVSKRFQKLHDIILFYSKSNQFRFNVLREPYGPKSGTADGHYKRDKDGRWFRWQKRKGQKAYKVFLSEGKRVGDVWQIPHINASARERLGYPTQKPEALLERIINASSNEGDLVLDPFCGCGTAIAVAQRLNREWRGIDITHLAITLIKNRLKDSFNIEAKQDYDVVAEPADLSGARNLARDDKFQFQWWALGLVNARPVEKKKGPDEGIDGRRYFIDGKRRTTEQIIFSVKGGHVNVKDMRDLRGVIERENAAVGALITLEEPTKPMRKEAAKAGFYHSDFKDTKHPRLQILTIEELLAGKKLDLPILARIPATDLTFKKAPKAKRKSEGADSLNFEE